ncbi:MAG: peptidylprolyl isomerase [Bacillota bacterium]|nr:peptidylprolyl isomerase [Bacillota bacterium]
MKENKVLAKVNGRKITENDLEKVLNSLPQQQAMQMQGEEGKKRLLNELIAGEMFYLDAVENELDKEEEFQSILKETKENLLQRYAVQKVMEDVDVKDEEIKETYNQNKDKFMDQEKVSAKHVLVDDEDKAKEIKEEIDNGMDFSDAAAKYSSCPSSKKGGRLGEFSRGQMVPEFEDVAFSMEEGEISDPVKSQFGYHIIQLDEKIPAKQKTYYEVENQIKQELLQQKQFQVYNDNVQKLKGKYNVEMDPKEIIS